MLTAEQCEKIKQLGEKEKEISKEIKSCIKSDKEGVFPVVDGIINIDNYVTAEYKILWLLKEPWGIWDKDKETGKPKLGGGSFPISYNKLSLEELEKEKYLLTARRVMEVTAAILRKTENKEDKLEALKSIAYVNIKKIPIDGDIRKISNKKELQEAYKEHRKLIKKQIDTYCPDIVICGNTLGYLPDDDCFDRKKTKRVPPIRYSQYCYYLTNNRLWINVHHPSYPKLNGGENFLKYKNRITSAVKDWEDFKKGMSE